MTPIRTPLGFIIIPPGDSLSAQGYAFQIDNPKLSDLLGGLGAFSHRHDAHAALADPTVVATTSLAPTGGGIPASTPIHVAYTLIDGQGGESLKSPVATLTTSGGFAEPTTAPTGIPDTTAGSLLANNYSYAITVTDGVGGETALSPSVTVIVPTGAAHNEAVVSGLTAIVTASSGGAGGAGWRLWRAVGGSPWYLIGSGASATDNFTDGGVGGDCTIQPPTVGTTGGGSELTVTVPSAGQPAGASYFNLYASTDGSFTSPCFLGQHPVASFDAAIHFTSIAVSQGSPPVVSRCYTGANKIDPDTDMSGPFPWKKAVATTGDLPAVGNVDGDIRTVVALRMAFVWDDTDSVWVPLAVSQRTAALTNLTALTATTETAATVEMTGKAMNVFSITVDTACRLRLYPTAALATVDIARAASEDQDVSWQAGCYFEHTFTAAETKMLTPSLLMVNQEGSPTAAVAANINVGTGTTAAVTLNGYIVEL